MSLRDLDIKIEYRTLVENITRDFYTPLLSEAVIYKRAVGFFSSSSLVELSIGLRQLVKNGGNIQLIVSPHLDENDVQAIRYGYQEREKIINEALLRDLRAPKNAFQEKHLNLLANLIADGILDVRVALTETSGTYGMYHEKVGIIEDLQGNKVAFSGSMNETANAFNSNYETIDVFTSWSSDLPRVEKKERAFDDIWNGTARNIKTLDFPELKDEIITRYRSKSVDYMSQNEFEEAEDDSPYSFFSIPDSINLYDYQKEAIEEWFGNSCCGIYDMATGTGKTYTALSSISKLSQSLDEKLACVIVVPYQHLVEQWVEDLDVFNVKPIVAYSYPGQNWRKEFSNAVRGYNTGAIDHFCIITTVASFSTDDFQDILKKMRKNFCFVADEAHNMGAGSVSKLLPLKARYRLALSATLERYGDAEGTQLLYKYFGKVCISYSLSEAIKNGYLSSYYYYPVLVALGEDELEEYQELTERIRKVFLAKKDTEDPTYTALLMKRSRIIAGCRNKVEKLLEVIEPYKSEYNILVYCGATKYNCHNEKEDVKQIEEVSYRLSRELGMKVRKFTSAENAKERLEIKQMFQNKELQVITAIKCLDEGVNIPAIKTAFILASSTNPKEYIQRRGRVLRLSADKEYAEIYDFITLPRALEDVAFCSNEELECDLSLVKRELNRMIDFASAARNPFAIDDLKVSIMNAYSNVNEGGSAYD